LPTIRYFTRSQQDIEAAAARLQAPIAAAVGPAYVVSITQCSSQIGSGALPLETMPSAGIAIAPAERKGAGTRLEALAAAFRKLPVPVIGRINKGEFLLDLRCLDDEATFLGQLDQLRSVLGAEEPSHAKG
jgi:L-seryl-tRNA(Ser) seleniumtransferase